MAITPIRRYLLERLDDLLNFFRGVQPEGRLHAGDVHVRGVDLLLHDLLQRLHRELLGLLLARTRMEKKRQRQKAELGEREKK